MAIERLTQLEVLEAVTNICRQMRILCKCQEPEEEFENQHQQLQLQLQFMRMLIKLTPNGYIDIARAIAQSGSWAEAVADAMSQSATASDNF